jgi:hypothetical protein
MAVARLGMKSWRVPNAVLRPTSGGNSAPTFRPLNVVTFP